MNTKPDPSSGVEDRLRLGPRRIAPNSRGGARWFRSPNVVRLEAWRLREQQKLAGGPGLNAPGFLEISVEILPVQRAGGTPRDGARPNFQTISKKGTRDGWLRIGTTGRIGTLHSGSLPVDRREPAAPRRLPARRPD